MRFSILLLTFFLSGLRAGQEDFDFAAWNDFAHAMNRYITDLQRGENNYGELKTAVRKWRRLEKQQGWDEIR